MSESPRNPEAPRRRRDEFLGILLVAAGLLLVAALFVARYLTSPGGKALEAIKSN